MLRGSTLLTILALVVVMIGCEDVPPGEFNLILLADPPGSGMTLDINDGSPYEAGTQVNIRAESAEG